VHSLPGIFFRSITIRSAIQARILTGTLAVLFCLTASTYAHSQISSQANDAPASEPTPTQLIQYLSQTIDWYRQSQQEQHIATEPADVGFAADNRRMADQIVKLAFEFARNEEQQLRSQSKNQPTASAEPGSRVESLSRAAAKTDQLVQNTQSELDSVREKLANTTTPSKRRQLEMQVAELQSELGLFQARQQALHSMVDFAGGASRSGGAMTLRSQIDELGRTVPAALSGLSGSEPPTAGAEPSANKTANNASKAEPTGIWGLTTDLFGLSSKRTTILRSTASTQDLEQTARQLRTPLVAHLKQLIQRGDALAQQADSADQNGLLQQKAQLDALTIEFKQVSGLLSSLSKQSILLDLYKRSLSNWQAEIQTEIKEKAKSLLTRVLGLAIAIGGVFLFGEFWRRAIFRYVHDPRRRYQFLLMRKIAIGCGLALVLIFAFVTELGAVATFAGLITAGIAVALQNVIVSIVGYFFLIGKFGIRIGDRVQVGGVTGEVVDIGLVRFHLMEYGGSGVDSEPTGRVVAFSNSVVFQSTTGLFKQIPGTNFLWREVTLRFSPDSDHRLIRERIQHALNSAFAEYRESLERQRRQMEMSISSVPASELKPRVRVHFTTSATELIVRYPVTIDKSAEIDERVIGEMFAAVDHDPKLKLLASEISAVKT
jgi:small-conductance mechanosensitive channel